MLSLQDLIEFCTVDVWRIRSASLPRIRQFWLTQLRIFLASLHGFEEDDCHLRASALTFYSLLSIVPIAAMAFGIAKGFGFEQILEKELLERFVGQEEIVGRIIGFARSLLENARGGLIAGIGVSVLLWSVLKVFSNIESSFNHIWGIKRGRTLLRKFSDYMSAMLICPILFIMSSSATVILRSKVEDLSLQIVGNTEVHAWLHTLLNFLPLSVTWLLFSFLYLFLPNTRVNFASGLIAGIIAGSLFQGLQWIYIESQIGVAEYGAIYGSFAALPLFLLWLHLSWLIVLFGAEISYAEQNVDTFELEPDARNLSPDYQSQLCIALTYICVKAFDAGQAAPDAETLSQHLGIPSGLSERMLHRLIEAGILCRCLANQADQESCVCFRPAIPTDKLSICDVLNRLEKTGLAELAIQSDLLPAIFEKTQVLQVTARSSPANILIRDLLSKD